MSEEQQTPENPSEDQPIVPQSVHTPPPNFAPGQSGFGMAPQSLPNATIVLILGILAIPGCCCYGIVGLILGIVAWVLGNSEIKRFNLAPNMYTEASLKNAKAGRICGIIATVLSAIYFIIIIGLIAVVGFDAIQDPDFMRQWAESMR